MFVVKIIPWNFLVDVCVEGRPRVVPANTVVLKSAESAPLSALYMANDQRSWHSCWCCQHCVGFGKIAKAGHCHPCESRRWPSPGLLLRGVIMKGSTAESNLKKSDGVGRRSLPNIIFDDADVAKLCNLWFWVSFTTHRQCVARLENLCAEGVYDQF